MKITFFGYDFSAGILRRMIADGHEIIQIFSFETDNIFSFNQEIENIAAQLNVPYSLTPVTPEQIEQAITGGTECFVAAGYPYKIPPIDTKRAYAINLHPTLLPHGRGIMPMPSLFLKYPQHSGITIHKLSEGFDEGDILQQMAVPITDHDDIEILSARVAMKSPDMIASVLANLENYWANAKPQPKDQGGWWKAPTEEERTLNWNSTTKQITTMIRAFGRYGMLANIDGQKWAVFESKAWTEDHNHPAGTVICRLSREYVIALLDGYIILKQFQPIQPPEAS